MFQLPKAIKKLVSHTSELNLLIKDLNRFEFRARWAIVIALSVLPLVSAVCYSQLIGVLTDSQADSVSLFCFWLTLVLCVAFVSTVFGFYQSFLGRVLQSKLEEELTIRLLNKRATLALPKLEDPEVNNTLTRVDEVGFNSSIWFFDRQFGILQSGVVAVLTGATLAVMDFRFFLVVLIASLPELVCELRYGERVWSIWSALGEVKKRIADYRWRLNTPSSVSELRVYGLVEFFTSKVRKLFQNFQLNRIASERDRVRSLSVATGVSYLGLGIALGYLGLAVLRSEIGLARFVFLFSVILTGRQSLSSFLNLIALQINDLKFVSDVLSVFKLPSYADERMENVSLKVEKDIEIAFDNVSFRYPGSEYSALSNINLKISQGEWLALVGPNGAGKSTILKLLLGFYAPSSGGIFVNGKDLKNITLSSWYDKLSVVFQGFSTFYLPLREVISLGDIGRIVSEEDVKRAAAISESSRFVEKLPGKFEQMLGHQFEGGVELSVGEYQKLGLARATYRGRSVFVLDEPASAIDSTSEQKFFSNLKREFGESSVIFVTHRIPSARWADKIVVVLDGKIHETGSHDELMNLNGWYAAAIQSQKDLLEESRAVSDSKAMNN